jgi:hypothetical protein
MTSSNIFVFQHGATKIKLFSTQRLQQNCEISSSNYICNNLLLKQQLYILTNSNFILTNQAVTIIWFTWPVAMCSPWWVSTGSTNWQKYFFPACLPVTPTSGLEYQSPLRTISYSKAIYQMVKLATVSTTL